MVANYKQTDEYRFNFHTENKTNFTNMANSSDANLFWGGNPAEIQCRTNTEYKCLINIDI